jgi:hypothetical protein
MVRRSLSYEKALSVLLLTGLITVTGCTSKSKNLVPDPAENTAAMERASLISSMKPGSPIETEALQCFTDFYSDYAPEAIREGVRKLYDENAWFGDPFHIVEGIDDIEHYFVVMAEPVEQCTFSVDSIHRSGDDYFARWTMQLESSAAKGERIETIGLSHIRFNATGKVIFQQDYWDTSAMFDRLPVVGYWTRLVKTRIAKGLEQ